MSALCKHGIASSNLLYWITNIILIYIPSLNIKFTLCRELQSLYSVNLLKLHLLNSQDYLGIIPASTKQ
jgi:hypothetical protein